MGRIAKAGKFYRVTDPNAVSILEMQDPGVRVTRTGGQVLIPNSMLDDSYFMEHTFPYIQPGEEIKGRALKGSYPLELPERPRTVAFPYMRRSQRPDYEDLSHLPTSSLVNIMHEQAAINAARDLDRNYLVARPGMSEVKSSLGAEMLSNGFAPALPINTLSQGYNYVSPAARGRSGSASGIGYDPQAELMSRQADAELAAEAEYMRRYGNSQMPLYVDNLPY